MLGLFNIEATVPCWNEEDLICTKVTRLEELPEYPVLEIKITLDKNVNVREAMDKVHDALRGLGLVLS